MPTTAYKADQYTINNNRFNEALAGTYTAYHARNKDALLTSRDINILRQALNGKNYYSLLDVLDSLESENVLLGLRSNLYKTKITSDTVVTGALTGYNELLNANSKNGFIQKTGTAGFAYHGIRFMQTSSNDIIGQKI
jgi:hypothetical protein